MSEIKAGLELDRAVAEAVGYRPLDFGYNPDMRDGPCEVYFRGSDSGIVSGEVWVWDRRSRFVHFSPSTDLNAAILAAGKVTDYIVVMKHESSPGGLWECKLSPRDAFCEWCRGETAALAICAAILKLKGVS